MNEQAWLADSVLVDGRFETGLAVVAGADGRILRLSRENRDLAGATRLAGKAMLPGFVNAHSHSFQRAIRGRTEYRTRTLPDTFWTWREKMYHAARALTPEGVYATARMCFLEMALAGITTVGEFHYLHHQPDGTRYADSHLLAKTVVRAAREVGLRIVLLQTGYARAGWKRVAEPGQGRFIYRHVEEFLAGVAELRAEFGRLYSAGEVSIGLAPHSLRAVTLPDFQAINHYAREHDLPVHMHVSEQRGENTHCFGEYGDTPLAVLARQGLLHAGFTAVHAIHVTHAEICALAEAEASVCACPTTERNLGDGIARTDEFMAAGVNLALGSDSQAQIAPLEDARELEYHLRLRREERAVLGVSPRLGAEDPDGLARSLWRCATTGGARALGSPGGDIAVGKPADFFTIDLRDPSIAGAGATLAPLVFGLERTAIRDVIAGGNYLVRDGKHAAAEAIIADFERVQQELWSSR